MGKWINRGLNPFTEDEVGDHIAVEDLARLADGRVETSERRRFIGHINHCRSCYQILEQTLADVSQAAVRRPESLPWWKTRTAYALAASIILVMLIGGPWTIRQLTKPLPVIQATLTLDRTLKDILLEDDALAWGKTARVNRLLAALQQRGVPVKELNRVVLSKPYYQKKSLFGPEEILNIRIENKVAYLDIQKKD